MRQKGYIYKDNRGKVRGMLRNGIINVVTDSIFVAAAFYFTFMLQSLIFITGDEINMFDHTELLRLSVGIGFCYAFIFVLKRDYKVNLIGTWRESVGHIWRNLTQAYVMFLALLFIGQELHFSAGRIWIAASYLTGFMLVYLNRFVIIPEIKSILRVEGKKNIVIVGSGKTAEAVSRQIKRQSFSRNIVGFLNDEFELRAGPNRQTELIASPDDIDRVVISDEVEELYVAGDLFTRGEILNLLDKFKGRKLKIVILGSSKDDFHLANIESTAY